MANNVKSGNILQMGINFLVDLYHSNQDGHRTDIHLESTTTIESNLQWVKPHDFLTSLTGQNDGIDTDNYKDNIIKPSSDIDEANIRFNQFYWDKVKIPDRDWTLSTFVVNNILSQVEDNMNKILKEDSEKGDQSRYSYLRIGKFCTSGSSSDGLKAYQPNEYDVEIPVQIVGKDGHSVVQAIGKQDGLTDIPHGWFKMLLTEPLDVKGNRNQKRLVVDKNNAQYLSTAGVKDMLKSVVQRAINEIPKFEKHEECDGSPWVVQPVIRSDKGPATALDILFGKELRNTMAKANMQPHTRISVDIVPRFALAKGKNDTSPAAVDSKGNNTNNITNPQMNAVAKPCMADETQGLDIPINAGLCQLFFRASFSEYEKLLLDLLNIKLGPGNCSKAVIQTMKTIQARDDFRVRNSELKSVLASYHIKTVFYHVALHSINTQENIEKYWSRENFTHRLGDMCNYLDKALDNRNLPHAMFNNPAVTKFDKVFEQLTTLNAPDNVNIFSRMKETTAGNIQQNLGQAFGHQLGIDFKDLCSLGKDGEAAYNWTVLDYSGKS